MVGTWYYFYHICKYIKKIIPVSKLLCGCGLVSLKEEREEDLFYIGIRNNKVFPALCRQQIETLLSLSNQNREVLQLYI